MKNIMKKIAAVMAIGMMVVGGLKVSARAADANVLNDTATILVTITPNVDRGVTIDTMNVTLNLGAVTLGNSTQTVQPSTVTITGSMSNTELDLNAQITGGWNFEPTAGASNTNGLKTWVVFTNTAQLTAPSKAGDLFDDTNDFLASATNNFADTRIGGTAGNGAAFEDGVVDMDALNPGMKRHMWMYFTTPSVTDTSSDQQIRFYLTVKQGS